MIYNPGNQLGKSVKGGGQRPANQPGGPFLGKEGRKIEYRQSATRERQPRSDRNARRKRKAEHPAEPKVIARNTPPMQRRLGRYLTGCACVRY